MINMHLAVFCFRLNEPVYLRWIPLMQSDWKYMQRFGIADDVLRLKIIPAVLLLNAGLSNFAF